MKDTKEKTQVQKKPNIVVRVLAFLVSLALVLGAVALVAWRDQLNLDALKRYMTYRSLSRSDSGQAEEFSFASDTSSSYTILDGGLLISSKNSIQLFSQSGVEYINKTVVMENPIITCGGKNAAVYDVGRSQLHVYSGREEVFSYEAEGEQGILGARMGENGWLALVTQESGYKAGVTVFDAQFQPVLRRNISSAFVMDAAVSPDGKLLAVVTVNQNGSSFESLLTIYPMSDGEAVGGCSLGDDVVMSLRWDSSGICIVGENSLMQVSAKGELQSTWSYSGRYLKDFSLGNGAVALLLGRYRSGSTGELVMVNEAGEELASRRVNEEVLSLSAAGRYLAVLTGEKLNIYQQDLKEYAALDNSGEIHRVLQKEDGSAMLITAGRASLFVPQ